MRGEGEKKMRPHDSKYYVPKSQTDGIMCRFQKVFN